jgi:alkylhydroperoxidase family enzyme
MIAPCAGDSWPDGNFMTAARFGVVQAHFDAQAMIDLTVTIAAYNMVSRFLVALQIGY